MITQFFGYPINYTNTERNKDSGNSVFKHFIADNDHNTFETDSGYVIDISEDSNATDVTHIFFKTKGVTAISVAGTGGTFVDQNSISVPTTVQTSGGKYVRIDADGWQNFLYPISADHGTILRQDATSLTITFTGTDIQVAEIMILDEALRMNADRRFTNIAYKLADRSSILQKDLADRITKISGLNEDRWKWDVDYTTIFTGEQINPFTSSGSLVTGIDLDSDNADGKLYDRLINFIRNRANNQFCFAGEYHRYPSRVYPATFPNPDIQVAFLSQFKASGEQIVFTVMEL